MSYDKNELLQEKLEKFIKEDKTIGSKSHLSFHEFYQQLNKQYTPIKGSLDIYHGNVINYNNMERHQLYSPDKVFEVRMSDIFDCHQYKNKKQTHSCPRFSVCLDMDYKLRIKIWEDTNHNAPLVWNFVLEEKKNK